MLDALGTLKKGNFGTHSVNSRICIVIPYFLVVFRQTRLDRYGLPFEVRVPSLLFVGWVHTSQQVAGGLVTPVYLRSGHVDLAGRVPLQGVQEAQVPFTQSLTRAVRVPHALVGQLAQTAGPGYLISLVFVPDQRRAVHVSHQLCRSEHTRSSVLSIEFIISILCDHSISRSLDFR